MLMNPAIQRTAQEQIDRVVGRHCFPEFIDRDFLPYITAVLYEVLRCVVLFVTVNNPNPPTSGGGLWLRWVRPIRISLLEAGFSCYTTR